MFKRKRIISFLLVIMMVFSVVGYAAEDGVSEGASEILEETDEKNIVQEEVKDGEEESDSSDADENAQNGAAEEENEKTAEEEIKEPEIPTSVITGKFNLLKVLGIIEESEDNLFLSDKAVTRAELMMYFAKISGLDKTYDKEYKGSFTDVDKKTPYYQSIQAMEFAGVVKGNGAGSFFPNDKVTVTDAVCSAVKLLGYDVYALSSGGYPSGYFVAANQAGITKGMEVSSFFDIFDENGEIVSEYNPSAPSHKTGIDVFNNTDAADEVALVSLKYKKNENGFNLLDSYSVKRLPLEKGYNRVDFNNVLIPDNDPSYVSKLIFLDSLYNPEMKAPIYSLANDGTSVTVTKTDKPAAASVVNSTIEAVNLDSEITISGIAQDAEEQPLFNVPVGLIILNKDAEKDDLKTEYDALSSETDGLASFVYSDITTTDIDGKYTFKVEMSADAPSGDYLLIANVGGKEVSATLRYLTTAQKQSSIEAINDALSKTADDLLNIIADSDAAFSLSLFLGYTSDEEMYNSVKDKASFFELVKSYGEYSEEFSEVGDSVNRFNKNLDNAILLSNLESIDDLAELKLNAESIAKQTGLIVDGITDANNDAVYTALSEFSDFSSLEKINKCIAGAIVLYNIPNAENWGAIKTAVESYSDLLGLDLSDSKVDYDEVYHKMYDLKAGYRGNYRKYA